MNKHYRYGHKSKQHRFTRKEMRENKEALAEWELQQILKGE